MAGGVEWLHCQQCVPVGTEWDGHPQPPWLGLTASLGNFCWGWCLPAVPTEKSPNPLSTLQGRHGNGPGPWELGMERAVPLLLGPLVHRSFGLGGARVLPALGPALIAQSRLLA